MKIQLKSLALFLAGAALVLTGCQNENQLLGEDAGNSPEASGRLFYVNAGIALPSSAGTRSFTDDEGPDDRPDNEQQTNSSGENNDRDKESTGTDYEYGYDYENDVRTMLLVFANAADNNFLAYSKVAGIDKAPTGSDYDFDVVAEVKYDVLEKAYAGNILGSDKKVKVYAFCNYTKNLETVLTDPDNIGKAAWIDEAGKIEESVAVTGSSIINTIWAKRSFLMSNYRAAETVFPATIEDWDAYADKGTPFYMGKEGDVGPDKKLEPILVERSAARFDFRDGSAGNNTYPIYTEIHELDGEGSDRVVNPNANLYSVQLTRMALVNMSKQFYYLRRVSNDGLNDNAIVGGVEGRTNYVVDVDADKKVIEEGATTGEITASNASTFFNFPLYTTDGKKYNTTEWYADDIKNVLNGTKDTWTGNNYRIWRYVTENTIPAAEKNQITVQSTGIVFKGRICPGENMNDKYDTDDEVGAEDYYVSEGVRDALDKTNGNAKITSAEEGKELPVLYSFDGFLYAGWKELIVKACEEEGHGSRLYMNVEEALKTALKNPGLKLQTVYEDIKAEKVGDDITDDILSPEVVNQGITVYRATDEGDGEGWGYYCYYFYWNRHNDNNQSGRMGNMEFATVRNNVYKLAVTAINRFGHPKNKNDDPDPVEPDDPDEEPTRYIQVDVDVLPWVVRVNEITF